MSSPDTGFPGWYQFFKDFVPLWTAMVALAGGWLGYRGVMAKVRLDRHSALETKDARSAYVAVEIDRCARMIARTITILIEAPSKEDACQSWNVSLKDRFASDSATVEKAVERLYDFIPEAQVGGMADLNSKLQSVKHAAYHLGRMAKAHPQLEGPSANKDLDFIFDIATRILLDLHRSLPRDYPEIAVHIDHPALAHLQERLRDSQSTHR